MSAITFLIAVGIDIAKAHFDAARLGADGKYQHKQCDNTPEGFALFAEWLAGFGAEPTQVCMEATGAYSVPLAESWLRGAFTSASSTPPGSPRSPRAS